MPFVNWPHELRLLVLEQLKHPDLHALSKVSKGVRILTEPVLYANILIAHEWQDHEIPWWLTLLLRTLLKRPQLCHYVRSLELRGDGFTYWHSVWEEETIPPRIPVKKLPIGKAVKLIHATRVPEAQAWVDGLKSKRNMDAIVALTLAMLPNLRSLRLGHSFTVYSQLIGMVLRCAVCTPGKYDLPAFRQLRSVTFSRRAHELRHTKAPNNALDIFPLLYLPEIQDLNVYIDTPLEYNWPAPTPPAPSSLTCLELGRVREMRLGMVLSALNRLQKLQWNWYHAEDLDPEVSTDLIEVDTMAEALAHVAETLTDLRIYAETFRSVDDHDKPFISIRGSLLDGGLACMGQLRKLVVPWAFLMGLSPSTVRPLFKGALPPSLEMLSMPTYLGDEEEDWYWNDESITREIMSWFDDWTGLPLPGGNLRRIELPCLIYEDRLAKEMIPEFKKIDECAGVKLDGQVEWRSNGKVFFNYSIVFESS